MDPNFARKVLTAARREICRLVRSRSGNTLAMVAAATLPLLAMIGGAIDMGRSYLSESRLQQACDAGVLAARKKLGSAVAAGGEISPDAAAAGNRLFNINFRNGLYGTDTRDFEMTLEDDYSVSGVAKVRVPTTVMRVFNFDQVDVAVNCQAKLNFGNTDVMMVLDTTGSMNEVLPGDSISKIDALRKVVKNFYAQIEGSKAPGTRIRYGFVPYSVNVNVGYLLKPEWVVDNWTYQGREAEDTGTTTTVTNAQTKSKYVSGTAVANAVYQSTTCPANTATTTTVRYWVDPDGTQNWEYLVNGTNYSCSTIDPDGNMKSVSSTTYTNYDYIYSYKSQGTKTVPVYDWLYKPVDVDLSFIKTGKSGQLKAASDKFKMAGSPSNPSNMTAWFRGCIEERSTYEIDDYNNVDTTRALDLDLDTVPTPGDPDTQWRPQLNEISFDRGIYTNGTGSFSVDPISYGGSYLQASASGFSVCPAQAQKLSEMTAAQVATYVDALAPAGNTYHDIGMIWGGRLISPNGLFASENADLATGPTNRNLIFLTDGETNTRDLSYGPYGIEPLDRRRWNPAAPAGGLTLTQVVEKRFTVACNEVKKHNITVWVIGFGTAMTDMLKNCAGDGHWFQANDSAELDSIFSKIAATMGDLRISK